MDSLGSESILSVSVNLTETDTGTETVHVNGPEVGDYWRQDNNNSY